MHLFSPLSSRLPSLFVFFLVTPETIEVDLENPYNNGFSGIAIFPVLGGIKGINGVDEHQGFLITIPVDKRFVLRDKGLRILARIYSANTIIISGVPMVDYSMLYHGTDGIKAGQQNGAFADCDFMIDAITNGNNDFMSEERSPRLFEQKREIHLVFPKNVQLDVACFKSGNQSEKDFNVLLPAKIVPMTNEYIPPSWAAKPDPTTISELTGKSYRMFFYVARVDTKSYKKNKTTFDTKTPDGELAQMFGI